MAGAEPMLVEVDPVVREVFGAFAAGTRSTTPVGPAQHLAARTQIPVDASRLHRDATVDGLGRDRSLPRPHNIERAVEALSLWRAEPPSYADIVYAANQVTKEAQLWPTATSN